MAGFVDSTPMPSRRAFFGTAVAAGVGVAQLPMFGEVGDAALLALAPVVEALIGRSNGLERDLLAADEMIEKMTGPPPKDPRDTVFAGSAAELRRAVDRYEADNADRCRRAAEIDARIGYDALTERCNAAYGEVVTARERLAGLKATTMAGVLAKARVAERAEWAELDRSVVADLVGLGLSS